jgi:hypothetical protein
MAHAPRRSKATAGLTDDQRLELVRRAADEGRSEQDRDLAITLLAGDKTFAQLRLEQQTLRRFVACGTPSDVLAYAKYLWERPKRGWDDRNEDWVTLILDRAEAVGLKQATEEVWAAGRPGQRLYRPITDQPKT